MRNLLFIELLLLLMPKVRFREVDTVPALIEKEPKPSLQAEKNVEVRLKPVDVKTGTKAQRESQHHQQGSQGRSWYEVIRKENP